MYETLIMIKPGNRFPVDAMMAIVESVAALGDATVEREGGEITLRSGDNYLTICFNGADYVVEESAEIAADGGFDCGNCKVRYEMSGEDDDMDLFNDYLIINERLEETGMFFIYDQMEGKLMFDGMEED